MQTPTISALPTPIVPVVPPMLPPGYGIWQNNAWYPCRLRNGRPNFIAGPLLNHSPRIHRYPDFDSALNFCIAEAALEHYEIQPLRNMEHYPDRIEEMEQWLFEHIGRYPCWWLEEAGGIGAGIYLGDEEVVPSISAHGSSLYEALIDLCSMIGQQQREAETHAWEADLSVWEDWWQETVRAR